MAKKSQHVFRYTVEQCLRIYAAYLLESIILGEHEEVLGDDFHRSDEGADCDGVFDSNGASPICLEAKTMVVRHRNTADINTRSGPMWMGAVAVSKTQLENAVKTIAFPILRQPKCWRVVLKPNMMLATKALKIAKHGRVEIVFKQSASGQKLENVVPSPLWPGTLSSREAPIILSDMVESRRLLHGSASAAAPQRYFESFAHGESLLTLTSASAPGASRESSMHLADASRGLQFRMTEYFRRSLVSIPGCPFKVVETKFPPLNADLAIRHSSGRLILVELKFGLCEVREMHGKGTDDVLVSHWSSNPHSPGTISTFTYTSGRWTYIVSTYGREVMAVPGLGELPRFAMVLHRLDAPSHLWYSSPNAKGMLAGMVNRSCLVDLASDFGTRLAALLQADLEAGRFVLPPLERFDCCTPTQLIHHDRCYEKVASYATKFVPKEEKENLKPHRGLFVYQARESLLWFHVCRDIKYGLIYDWQYQCSDFRAFAFTFYDWTTADSAYVSVRPCRTPVQIFERPNAKALFLSFCSLRPHPDENCVFLAPAVTRCLRGRYNGGLFKSSHILVITAHNTIMSNSLHAPVYAVPTTAIAEEESVKNWSRWRIFRLKKDEELDEYLFRDRESLIVHLRDSQNTEQTHTWLGKHRIDLITIDELYAAIHTDFSSSEQGRESDDDLDDGVGEIDGVQPSDELCWY